jgi:hypothetical protein
MFWHFSLDAGALPCRFCGERDRFYVTGEALCELNCRVGVGVNGADAIDPEGEALIVDITPFKWTCRRCGTSAESPDDLVRPVYRPAVGQRVVLPHGPTGEIEHVRELAVGRELTFGVTVNDTEYASTDLAEPTALAAGQQTLFD